MQYARKSIVVYSEGSVQEICEERKKNMNTYEVKLMSRNK